MGENSVELTIQLPVMTIEYISRIAKKAGISADTVVNVLLAIYLIDKEEHPIEPISKA